MNVALRIKNIKSLFFVFTIFIIQYSLFSAPSAHAAIKSPPSNLGLVGYWSFDDCKGATSSDRSGYGNTGSLTNFALSGSTSNWVTGNAAKLGCALQFDGVNDYIQTQLTPTGYTGITMATWVKISVGGAYSAFISQGTNVENVLELGEDSSGAGKLNCMRVNDNTAVTDTVSIIGTGWHHVACVSNGTTFSLYKDGVLVSSSSVAHNLNSTTPFRIGRRGNDQGSTLYTNGSLDEVRIYNRALSASEVAGLYNSGTAKVKAPDKTGLVGHWTFDDGRGATSTDSSGQGNVGSLINFALSTSTSTSNWNSGSACKRGGCLNFDGTDDRVDTTTNTALDMNATGWSLSAWANFTDRSTFHAIASKWDNPGTPVGWYVAIATDGKVDFAWNAADRYSTATVSTGAWHHIVATHDGATTGKIYIDGVLDSTHTAAILGVSTAKLVLGRVSNSFPMKGNIDDVRIYNRALSATEVSTLYNTSAAKMSSTADLQRGTNLSSGLVGHWTFDGKYMTTTTSTDTSGQGNNGTLTNGPVPAIGKLGQALQFDGVNDYVNVPDNNSLDATTALTVSYWFKKFASNSKIEVGKGAISPTASYHLEVYSDGNAYFYVSGNGSTVVYTAGAVTADTNWHHLVGVYNGTTIKIYFDGIAQSFGTAGGSVPASLFNNSIAFQIGTGLAGGYGHYTAGSLDDVRVYNRALSAGEVGQLYGLGR